jgi:hypothetical protein
MTLQLLCFDKQAIIAANPKGASNLSTMSNFQIFMTLMATDEDGNKSVRENNVINVLTIFLPGYTV